MENLTFPLSVTCLHLFSGLSSKYHPSSSHGHDYQPGKKLMKSLKFVLCIVENNTYNPIYNMPEILQCHNNQLLY